MSKGLQLPFSSELALKVLKTVPVMPIVAKVSLFAGGLRIPDSRGGEIDTYNAGCIEKNIAPNSWIRFSTEAPGPFKSPSYERGVCLKPEDVLMGRRIHNVVFTTCNYFLVQENDDGTVEQSGRNSFEDLKKMLDGFASKGYQPLSGDLTLSSYHLTGYNEGDYAETNVTWDASRADLSVPIRLAINTDGHNSCNPENANRLVKWFEGLSA